MTDTDDTVGLSEAQPGDLVHDLGCESDTGWFIVGRNGYWDVDNACCTADQEGDSPWTSEHFAIIGPVARVAAERERADAAEAKIAAVEALCSAIEDAARQNDHLARLGTQQVRAALAPREDTRADVTGEEGA